MTGAALRACRQTADQRLGEAGIVLESALVLRAVDAREMKHKIAGRRIGVKQMRRGISVDF